MFQFNPGASTLNVDGWPFFSLSEDIQKIDITPSQTIEYRDGLISNSDESISINNVNHLYYYNGLLLHMFDGSKIDPILDSGRVYYNPHTRTALYISDIDLITRMERAIAVLPRDNPTTTEAVSLTTDSPTPPIITQTTQHETVVTSSIVDSTTVSEAIPTTKAPNPCDSVGETSKTKKKFNDCIHPIKYKSRKREKSSSISGDEQTQQSGQKSVTRSEMENTRPGRHLNDSFTTRNADNSKTTGRIASKPHSRKIRQSEADVSQRHVPTKAHTTTLNFELSFDNGHINLLHNGKKIIDLSNLKKQTFSHSQTLVLEHKSLKIINGTDHIQREYKGVKSLIIFDGTHISERRGLSVRVQVSNGQLFVGGDKAFYSSSQQLNMLLNDQLVRVIPRQSDSMLMFQTLPGGDLILLIEEEPVITLGGAEVRAIPISNFIRYVNSTIYVHDVAKHRLDEVYSGVNQFYVLNGVRPGLKKYNESISKQVPGGGRLYVHITSGGAFYSRSSQINNAISEHIKRLSEPPSSLVFAITFENNRDGGNDGIPEVALLVNSDKIFRFDPRDTEDQSLMLKHSLKYTNETLFILEGSDVAGAFIEVKELVVFDGFKIGEYERSAVIQFAGGGQIFKSGSRAFYSVNTNLNDQIGEALLAARSVSQIPLSIPTDSPLTTVPAHSHTTLPPTSTECEGYLNTDATPPRKVIDNSRRTKTTTRPKRQCSSSVNVENKSPKPVKPDAETRPVQLDHHK